MGRSKGQTSNQVNKGEECAKRAYGIGKRWRPRSHSRRTDENISEFFSCAIPSARYHSDITGQVKFSRSRTDSAKQPRGSGKSAEHADCKSQNNSGGSQPRGD